MISTQVRSRRKPGTVIEFNGKTCVSSFGRCETLIVVQHTTIDDDSGRVGFRATQEIEEFE